MLSIKNQFIDITTTFVLNKFEQSIIKYTEDVECCKRRK